MSRPLWLSYVNLIKWEGNVEFQMFFVHDNIESSVSVLLGFWLCFSHQEAFMVMETSYMENMGYMGANGSVLVCQEMSSIICEVICRGVTATRAQWHRVQ